MQATPHVTPADATARMMQLLDDSPSPYHAVASVASRLEAAGFTRLAQADVWSLDDVEGSAYVERGGSLVAWHTASSVAGGLGAGLRLVGAHSDSPNLRIKPRPDTGGFGYRQLGVEVYGGVLLNSWLDRDLGISGRVALRSGETLLVRIDEPLLRIPQLAIHLDRSVNDSLALDKQQHMTPVWGVGSAHDGDFVQWLAERIDVDRVDLLSYDLMTHDLTPARLLGQHQKFVASARIDNLNSCSCALDALLIHAANGSATNANPLAMLAIFDHEEVGSETPTGAGSPLVRGVLERIASLAAPADPQALARALASGFCVSADAAHAVHPNYPERHEPNHRPLINAGPVIKINANARYATDAETAAEFIRACAEAGVPYQHFVSNNTMPCGSTIGPITAAGLGIPTVDVGNPMLSMHSAREMCGTDDAPHMVGALRVIYGGGR